MLEVNTTTVGEHKDISLVNVKGYIDSNTAPDFEEAFSQLMSSQNTRKIIVNCKDVSFISSAGIGVFMIIRRTLETRNGQMVILALSDEIHNVFDLLGFTRFFKMCQTLPEALAQFEGKPGGEPPGPPPPGRQPAVEVKPAGPLTPAAPVQFPTIIRCPQCQSQLKVPQAAKYRCARCQSIFQVSFAGVASLVK